MAGVRQARFIPSNQTRGERQISSGSLAADNQLIQVDVPRGPHNESLLLRVFGSANITTNFASVRNAAASRIVRRFDWLLNSNVTLDSRSGQQVRASYFTRPNIPADTQPAGFVIAVQPFEASFILDRAVMDMIRPKDSLLKTDDGISSNQLRIQFGALSDMFTGAGVANYVSGVSYSLSLVDYLEARIGGETPAPAWYSKYNGQQVAVPSGNQNQIKVSTGNRLRYISIRVLDPTTGEPNLALMTRVRLIRSGDTRIDMPTTDLLRLNQAAYGNGWQLMTGQVVVDLANNGQSKVPYSEFWPIPSSADTFLVVDTSGACVLDITTLEGVDLVNA